MRKSIRSFMTPVFVTNDGKQHTSLELAQKHHDKMVHDLFHARRCLRLAIEKHRKIKSTITHLKDRSHPYLTIQEPYFGRNIEDIRTDMLKKYEVDKRSCARWIHIYETEIRWAKENLREEGKKIGLFKGQKIGV